MGAMGHVGRWFALSASALIAVAVGCTPGGADPVSGSGGAGTVAGSGGALAGTGGSGSGGAGTGGSTGSGGGSGPGGASGGAGPTGTGGSSTGSGGSDGGGRGGSSTGGTSGGGRGGATPGSGGTSGGGGATDPGTEGDGRTEIQSPFRASPAQTVAAGVPRGQRPTFMMMSTTYPGNARRGAVYVPAGYTSGTELPFMVVQDGIGYVNNVSNALDNLIQQKKVPAMAVIFIDPGAGRSQEYDTVSDKYTTFVETELLPAAKNAVRSSLQLDLALTSNPEGRGSMGGSSGAAAAFTMGWFHPELYRRIVSYSGSFVKLAPSTMYPNGAGDYHGRLIAATEAKPLRVFLAVGTNDLDNQFGSWLEANDAMFAALTARGYHVRYVRATGGVHVDGGVLTQTLADTLVWVWRGYPIK
jgi:iron(III)-enterobactin esterase